MTFSVTRDLGDFEWAGEGLFGVFCQAKNLSVRAKQRMRNALMRIGSFNPRMYRMLLDVFRFNLFGLDLVTETTPGTGPKGETGQSKRTDVDEANREISIGEYLEKEGYGEGFKEDYLLVSCAITYPN
jgi:predicted NAD/FAD-binding protein